ncbi:MAG TPA: hypothetical protein VIG99_29930 [Myxococcaceae bacterium]|jgi:hypothetical protein
MNRSLAPAVVLVSLVAAGCAQPQRPFRFELSQGGGAPIDAVAGALASEGYPPAEVDRQTGVMSTQWQDTGFLYGYIDQVATTIVRRWIVVVSTSGPRPQVILRMDAKNCVPGGFSIGELDFRRCVQMEGMVETHQRELDELGHKLEKALGASNAAG